MADNDKDKNEATITADIPASVFEEALRAVENIQAEARKKPSADTPKSKEDSIEINISDRESSELIDLMELLDAGDIKKSAAKKPVKPKNDVADSDLAVLSQLLEEEYNLEKEANFFKNVLFDSLQKSESQIDNSLLKEKETQIKELLDRLSKLQTEFEKFRQRLTKEAETAKKFSNESLILQILPILDNLERAIEHADRTEEKAAMVQGVRLIHKQLVDTLEASGVTIIEAKGKRFDPTYHDAIVMLETDEVAPNIVISEYQVGYLLHDRLLRPSKVVVSKRSDGEKSSTDTDDNSKEPIVDVDSGETAQNLGSDDSTED